MAKTVALPAPKLVPRLKTFNGTEFSALYALIAYPNTQEILTSTSITGDEKADERIAVLAKARGYVLRSLPVSTITKIGEPALDGDDLLQEKAARAWVELKDSASKSGLPLQLTSAYRSPEFQRELWLSRMSALGVDAKAIASGQVDDKVNMLLETTAPPSFSRHHTGYTIDVACDGVGLAKFEGTVCYQWLAKDNYKNAKTLGWIPSYPKDSALQGPNPEPWEFVWVGKDALTEYVAESP
jgi:LAS superfamily LD-carboxypeptidase LdcB